MDNTGVKQTEVVNGANPTMLYAQYMDYLLTLCKVMKKTYTSRTRDNKPITWAELDELNNKLHNDLDIIMCGHKNVQNENKQLKSEKMKSIRLTESDIRRMVMEALNELDWKTYMNAGDKTYGDRALKFYKSAADAFQRDYGNKYSTVKPNDRTLFYSQGVKNMDGTNRYDYSTITDRGPNRYGDDSYKGFGGIDWPHSDTYDVSPYLLKSLAPDSVEKFDKMDKEYKSRKNYNYEKGKGWSKKNEELDEAVTRAIRKYLR